MRRDERDPQDMASEQPRSRTDRLEGGGAPAGEPINPGWRSARTAGRSSKPMRTIPTSSQDFVVWLQYGGWRFVVATVGIVGVIALMIILTSSPTDPEDTFREEPLPDTAGQIVVNTPLPTVTPAPAIPTQIPAVTGAKFRVTGTGAEGLFLRPEPSTANPPLLTIEEGAEVTIIGEDRVQPDRVWKNIRTAQGAEGWVAADFLKPVP
jgi:Bacterial SH3 domain